MTTVIAKLKVKAGSEQQFREAADEMITQVKTKEPGTLRYILHRSTSDAGEFLFYEIYEDQAALAAHSSSEAMQQFFGAIGGLLEGRPEISMYEEVGGKQ
jgi:quinol monooxygenase YgiN